MLYLMWSSDYGHFRMERIVFVIGLYLSLYLVTLVLLGYQWLILRSYRLSPYHFEVGQFIGLTLRERFTLKILPVDAAIDWREENDPDRPYLLNLLLVTSHVAIYLLLSLPFLIHHGLAGAFSWIYNYLVPILGFQYPKIQPVNFTIFDFMQILSFCCFIILLLHFCPGRGMAPHNIFRVTLNRPIAEPNRIAFNGLVILVSYLLLCTSVFLARLLFIQL